MHSPFLLTAGTAQAMRQWNAIYSLGVRLCASAASESLHLLSRYAHSRPQRCDLLLAIAAHQRALPVLRASPFCRSRSKFAGSTNRRPLGRRRTSVFPRLTTS